MSALLDAFLGLMERVDEHREAAIEEGTPLSIAVTITDGERPGDGLTMSMVSGRYGQPGTESEYEPDARAAAEERRRIRDAIADAIETDAVDVEGLTDDIVAALAGE